MELIDIKIQVIEMGDDLALMITGGKAHIGATSTAYWHNETIKVHTVELPGHKEGNLTESFAYEACQRFGVTVTVAMGIHKDHATKEEIAWMVSESKKQFHDILVKLEEKRRGQSSFRPL